MRWMRPIHRPTIKSNVLISINGFVTATLSSTH